MMAMVILAVMATVVVAAAVMAMAPVTQKLHAEKKVMTVRVLKNFFT
jgi:hypothetical protein